MREVVRVVKLGQKWRQIVLLKSLAKSCLLSDLRDKDKVNITNKNSKEKMENSWIQEVDLDQIHRIKKDSLDTLLHFFASLLHFRVSSCVVEGDVQLNIRIVGVEAVQDLRILRSANTKPN